MRVCRAMVAPIMVVSFPPPWQRLTLHVRSAIRARNIYARLTSPPVKKKKKKTALAQQFITANDPARYDIFRNETRARVIPSPPPSPPLLTWIYKARAYGYVRKVRKELLFRRAARGGEIERILVERRAALITRAAPLKYPSRSVRDDVEITMIPAVTVYAPSVSRRRGAARPLLRHR